MSQLTFQKLPRQQHLHQRYDFFFNDMSTTEIYTLSLHDALPISRTTTACGASSRAGRSTACDGSRATRDRKSTRLNSRYVKISYAVFCLKKKKDTLQWQAAIPSRSSTNWRSGVFSRR